LTASAALEGGPQSRGERAFPCLDGARALAATAVVATHAAYWAGDYGDGAVGRVLSRFDVGVPVFFVLSGFLLSRPFLLAAVRRGPAPRPAAYLWRRALRILPAYWLTVVAALLLLPGNRGAGPGDWVAHLGLAQIYGSATFADGLSHTWSLCTEVAFYLVLPLIAAGVVRLVRRCPDRPTAALAALGAGFLLAPAWLAWVWIARPAPGTDLWLPGFAGWFGAGMVLALLSVADPRWRPARLAHELAGSLPTCWALAGALFWIATSPLAGPLDLSAPTPGQAITKNLLYLGVAALFVLPLVFGDQRAGRVRRALSGPPMAFLGEISYGLFLVHVVVLAGGYAALGLVPFTGNVVLVLVATWVVSVGIAAAVYLLVERPVRRWRHLVPDRAAAARPAGTAEASTAPSAANASA
jgi:peptidoglycan/LPS O-acetylase OafA/YrhL